MKKLAYLVLIPALGMTLLSGCSNESDTPKSNTSASTSSDSANSQKSSGFDSSNTTLEKADKTNLEKSLTASGVKQKSLSEAADTQKISDSALGTITGLLGQKDAATGGAVKDGKFSPNAEASKYLSPDIAQKVVETVKNSTTTDLTTPEGRISAASTVSTVENGKLQIDPQTSITVSSVASKVKAQKIVPIAPNEPGYAEKKTRVLVISTIEKTVKGVRDNGVEQSVIFTGDFRFISEYQDGQWVVVDALM